MLSITINVSYELTQNYYFLVSCVDIMLLGMHVVIHQIHPLCCVYNEPMPLCCVYNDPMPLSYI